jgi:hypothetical protein
MDLNNGLRDVVKGSLGAVPEVGWVLSALTSVLWPQTTKDPLQNWNEIKQYAEKMCKALIAAESTKQLEERLEGIRRVLNDYKHTSLGSRQKGEWFTSLLAVLDETEPFFFDKDYPEKTLPYFVAMGTLKLAALREQCLFYKDIYLIPDPDAVEHLQELKDKIREYTDAAADLRKRVMKWRLDMIQRQVSERMVSDFGNKVRTWVVSDAMDGWSNCERVQPVHDGRREWG